MNFADFNQQAWAEHAEAPEQVAARLVDGLAIARDPDQVHAWIRLSTHVLGEHLGRWDEGLAMLDRAQAACADDAAALAGLRRCRAALHWSAGRTAAVEALTADEAIGALGVATSALAERGQLDRAIETCRRAQAMAEAGVPEGSTAPRALAVATNNLAATLQTMAGRSEEQTQAMLSAAAASLVWWRRAGTWLEEERAHWRIARCRLAAGDGPGAAAAARDGLAVCAAHDAPPFERFFLLAALSLALHAAGDEAGRREARDAAMQAHEQVPPEDQTWCAADLRELGGLA